MCTLTASPIAHVEVRDPLNRAAGRVRVAPEDQPPIPGGSKAGFQYQPPVDGEELIGWFAKATFPTGPENVLKWHDGFVVECVEKEREGGTQFIYTIFFPVDLCADVVYSPFDDKSICFRKSHLLNCKATEREMARARVALQTE